MGELFDRSKSEMELIFDFIYGSDWKSVNANEIGIINKLNINI